MPIFANWGQAGQLAVALLNLIRRPKSSNQTTLPASTGASLETENNIKIWKASATRSTCRVGDFWQLPGGGRVKVRSLVSPSDANSAYRVQVETQGGGMYFPAPNAQSNGYSQFTLSESRDTQLGQDCIYNFVCSSDVIICYALCVTHINPHANEVELEFLYITGARSGSN